MPADLDHIRAIAERVAQSNGLEVVEVELRGGGKARMLRIYIDKPAGITHADCEALSREVSAILDVEEAVPGGQYVLEVSSPGLDRKLLKTADYERFAGSRIKVQTREPVNGTRHLEGRLQGLQGGRVAIELMAGKKAPATRVDLELGNIEKANLVPEF
ncbi:MAG: ribosome maturation factor RimP [Terriglobales bacterium]|jgi:ribosome maturation factor RimP